MARFQCPQCGRRFGSVGDMLEHTQQVHADAEPYADLGAQPAEPARGMPSPEPGPVATERASQTDFDIEPFGSGNGGTFGRGPAESSEEEEAKPGGNLGTIIALLVIGAIILLNILAGGSE